MLVEGIGFDAGSGEGYNSGDYKFIPFEVVDYNDAVKSQANLFSINVGGEDLTDVFKSFVLC